MIKQTQGIPDDVYMTVVALCKGYQRRRRFCLSQKEKKAPRSHAFAYSEYINNVIEDSIAETCDPWLAKDMLDCIAEYTGFSKYKNNHLISRTVYYDQKRAAMQTIAERLSLY